MMRNEEKQQQRVIDIEKLLQLTRMLPQSAGFGLALSVVATVFLYRSQPPVPLFGWLGIQVLLTAWRIRVARRFHAIASAHTPLGSRQVDLIRLGCFASGLAWGALALGRFPADEP